MRLSPSCAVLTALLFGAGAAGAADLSKIERRISKEPAYKSQPKYCLLVFGAEARHRVWLVLDGDTLYVDRNGNGDLTEEGEQVKGPAFKASDHPAHERERSIEAGAISAGGLTHAGLTVSQTEYRRKVGPKVDDPASWQEYLDAVRRQAPDGVAYMVSVNLDARCYAAFADKKGSRVHHFAWLDERGHLLFADRPQDAPVIPFGGPLTLRAQHAHKLRRGDDQDRTTVYVGTYGLGPGSFVHMGHDLVPPAVHPVVEVRFPPKAPGREPVTRKYVLKERCWGHHFYGPVRVPEEAGLGMAKVALAFDGWKAGRVAPAAAEIPVTGPKAEKSAGR